MVSSQKVPGYATLGTTFNTANTSGNDKDGGTFGGIDFTSRPDALSLYYKRTQASGSTEQATVVAYLWKGTVTQNNVRVSIGSKPTTVSMENRDRNILGMETAYGDTPKNPPTSRPSPPSTTPSQLRPPTGPSSPSPLNMPKAPQQPPRKST